MNNKKYRPTLRDLVLGKEVSRAVVQRGKVLNEIIDEVNVSSVQAVI